MANTFPSASQRNPDLANLTIIHTEVNALQAQVLIDRAIGLRGSTLSNTLLTSSAVGAVVTPVNYLRGTTALVDSDTTKVLDGGSTFILNDQTVTLFNQVDGTNGAPDAGTTNIIITSSVTGSGAVPGASPVITGLGGQAMTVNLRTIIFTDLGGGDSTQAQAVVDINAVLSVTQGISASFAADVITLTKTLEGTDLTEDIDITSGNAITTLNLSISTTGPTGNLVFGGTGTQSIAINAARTLNELVADINTDVAAHGITASVRDTGILVVPAERFVLRLTKDNNTNGTDLEIDGTSTALILTELGLTVDTTVITLDDIAAQFQAVSSITNVAAVVAGAAADSDLTVEFSTNIDSGQIEIDGPILLEGATSTADETGAGFLTAGGTLTFGGTANQNVVFGAADNLLGLVATINLATGNHGITASSYDTGVIGATRYHLRLEKSNVINGANILVDAGSTAQVLTDLGLTAGTTSTTFMGFPVAFGVPTFYINLATDNIFFEDGPFVGATAGGSTVNVHGFTTGDQLEVISDGVLISPLKGFPDSRWYAINIDADNLKIAQTNALALAGTPVDLAVFGAGSFQIKSLLSSELYFEVWKGLLEDRVLKQHMDEVIAHFEALGYVIFRSTNTTTGTTFDWVIRW